MPASPRVLAAAAALTSLSSLPAARADAPRGTYVVMPEGTAAPEPAAQSTTPAAAPTLVYLNRDGGTYTYGYPNDSSANVSIIPDGSAQVPPWDVSDDGWRSVMTCVRDQFSRFNVIITDEDPGDQPHIEAVVAGYPSHVGQPPRIGGISPFSCEVPIIRRSIVFVFAELYGSNYTELCYTATQEIAHSFGLDHELLCTDPMTYLQGCGPKRFRDQAAPCGEWQGQERTCQCGEAAQNSVEMLFERLGAGDPVPPAVGIREPSHGAELDAGFSVVADAEDDAEIRGVQVHVDGEAVGVATTQPPYEFPTTADLESGVHTVEVLVTDGINEVRAAVQVFVRGADFPDSCADDTACPNGYACDGDACSPRELEFAPRALGAFCASDAACDSGLCLSDGTSRRCTRFCGAGGEAASCPEGLECAAIDTEASLCWPGGGLALCSLSGPRGAGGAAALLLALLLIARRRAATAQRR